MFELLLMIYLFPVLLVIALLGKAILWIIGALLGLSTVIIKWLSGLLWKVVRWFFLQIFKALRWLLPLIFKALSSRIKDTEGEDEQNSPGTSHVQSGTPQDLPF